MMQVGFVVYGGLDERPGDNRYARKLVEHLEARGDEVTVIDIPWRTYPRHLTDSFSPELRRRLDRSVDVLVQDALCHPSLWRHNRALAEPGAVVALVDLLRSAGSSLAPLYRPIEGRYFASVDGVICTSRFTERGTLELAGVPSTVAYPGGRVGEAALTPEKVRQRAVADPLRILFVGDLIERKGTLTLIEALGTLDGSWEATVLGSHEADPAYADRVGTRVRSRGLSDRVSLPGAVTTDRICREFARSDVLAVPSTSEGLETVHLDAMEFGVVPVACTVGGAGEIVDDGMNGFLVEPGDPGGVREALATLRDDRGLLRSLAEHALRTADAHPDWPESMETARQFLIERQDDTRQPPTPDA